MNKIVISGFYGFHNIGDEAILRTLTTWLKEINPSVEITVLSNHPEETMSKFNVNAVNRSNVFEVFKAIFKSELLISGGGSLLQDVTSARSIHYYMTIIRAGLFFRKKVVLLSHGVGPLIREKNKKRVKRLLNRVDAITVRDQQSANLLAEIGVRKELVEVTTDPVMGMPMESIERGKSILKSINAYQTDRKSVAIAVRQKDFREPHKLSELIALTNRLASKYEVYYLPFYYKNDTKICHDLKDEVDDHVHFITEKYQSGDFMSLVKNMDLLIGSRLHSLIFAIVAEVPFVGVSYDPKIENFLETIERKPVCHIADFDPDIIYEAVEAVFNAYETEKTHLLAQKASLVKKLDGNIRMLNKVTKAEAK